MTTPKSQIKPKVQISDVKRKHRYNILIIMEKIPGMTRTPWKRHESSVHNGDAANRGDSPPGFPLEIRFQSFA